jgi:hypothetical protein
VQDGQATLGGLDTRAECFADLCTIRGT